MPWGMVAVTTTIYTIARLGKASDLTTDVHTVLHRPPTGFATFAERERETFSPGPTDPAPTPPTPNPLGGGPLAAARGLLCRALLIPRLAWLLRRLAHDLSKDGTGSGTGPEHRRRW